MRIYFKRSGGFHGMRLQADFDTASLPSAEAEAIEQMLTDANFFELASGPQQARGADHFTYELTVSKKDYAHTVIFTEENTPAEITALLDQLTAIARRPPSSDVAGFLLEPDEPS